jgi:hypothetical protein
LITASGSSNEASKAVAVGTQQTQRDLGDAGSAFEVDPDSCVVAGGDRNEQSVEWVSRHPKDLGSSPSSSRSVLGRAIQQRI